MNPYMNLCIEITRDKLKKTAKTCRCSDIFLSFVGYRNAVARVLNLVFLYLTINDHPPSIIFFIYISIIIHLLFLLISMRKKKKEIQIQEQEKKQEI